MILELLYKFKTKVRDWSVEHVHGTRAKFWLAILSFSEASFFVVPPDVFLITILAVNAQRWVMYSSITTIFSILGGIVGYGIGIFFFDFIGEPIIALYNLQDQMLVVAEKFNQNAFLAVLVSAFTPIPFKIFTISGGFFKINFLHFLSASIIGRSARFFLVGFVMKKYGKKMTSYLFKYFDIATLGLILLLIIILFLI
ncbi:VTT domain-containing protein [Patescibacteria group bacterium]|nr:VTT domain-containing protein [Patescibacteria group bacterium]